MSLYPVLVVWLAQAAAAMFVAKALMMALQDQSMSNWQAALMAAKSKLMPLMGIPMIVLAIVGLAGVNGMASNNLLSFVFVLAVLYVVFGGQSGVKQVMADLQSMQSRWGDALVPIAALVVAIYVGYYIIYFILGRMIYSYLLLMVIGMAYYAAVTAIGFAYLYLLYGALKNKEARPV